MQNSRNCHAKEEVSRPMATGDDDDDDDETLLLIN